MSPEVTGSIVIAAVGATTLIARRTGLADPILLVLCGAVIALLPGLPAVEVSPDILLLGVLPPLLFWHAFIVTPRDVRANSVAVGLLSVVLVLATAAGVAWVMHHLAGMPWGVAVALGAIVAPTDPVAFLTVARRLNVSPRLVGLLDGENLLNDFTALVVYTTAVQATLDGTFSPAHSLGELVWTAAVGVALGYAVGRTVSFVNARVDDPSTAPIIVLCGCYLAFLPAEALHVSAILAAGVAGRVIGARSPVVDLPRTRLTGYGFWNTWIFLLTAVLFMLIGLQLSVVVDALPDTPAKVTAYCLACAATVIVLRMLFILTMGLTVPPIARRMRLDGARPWAESLVAGWAGMRGAICLVMALALPADFPYRPIVLVCTFAVILITLVGQGLTLPWLIHHTPVERDTLSAREQEELRERTQRAAEARLGELEASGRVSPATAAALRTAHRATAPPDPGDEALARLRLDLIAAERQEAIRLRREGRYGDEVLREHERCLDLRATLITESSHATDRHTATTHARPGQETDPG